MHGYGSRPVACRKVFVHLFERFWIPTISTARTVSTAFLELERSHTRIIALPKCRMIRQNLSPCSLRVSNRMQTGCFNGP